MVQFVGLLFTPFAMVIEYCGGGTLFDFIHNYQNNLPWPLLIRIATDMASGLQYLHGTYHLPLPSLEATALSPGVSFFSPLTSDRVADPFHHACPSHLLCN